MVFLKLPELTLKWSFFVFIGGMMAYEEYSPLFLKQLGFTASQVGFTTGLGLPVLFVPAAFGFLGDRFRSRKLVLFVLLCVLVLMILAPLLALVSPIAECNTMLNTSILFDTKKFSNESSLSVENVTNNYSQKTNTSNSLLFSAESNYRELKNETANAPQRRVLTWSSGLFIYITLTRGVYEALKRAVMSSYNVATMTWLQNDRTKYGSYYCWGHIGSSFSVFVVGAMAAFIKLPICGSVGYGYFIACIFAAFVMSHTFCVLPWITYEYIEDRVINWSDVRGVVFNCHYLVVLFVGLFCGCSFSYQTFWENWYIEELSGGPLLMASCGLVRRPFLALWFYMSGRFVDKVGDLKALAAALLLAAVSLLALSFLETAWPILVIGIFMSAALAVSYSALTVHLSKAASKASSSVILALADGSFAFGMGAGTAIMGVSFSHVGPQTTLLYFAVVIAIVFVLFIGYIFVSDDKYLDKYEKVPDSDEESAVEVK